VPTDNFVRVASIEVAGILR